MVANLSDFNNSKGFEPEKSSIIALSYALSYHHSYVSNFLTIPA